MSSKELAERMSRALEGSGLADPRSANFGDNRIAVLCRVPKDKEPLWIELITKILIGSSLSSKTNTSWQCHICRHYFLRETNGEDKLVWGWNFSVQAKELVPALDAVIRLVKGQPVEEHPNELKEFPLGTTSNRGAPIKGKGAFIAGDSEAFALWTGKR
jgi:hypothetical protein